LTATSAVTECLTPVLIEYRYWILIPLSVLEGPIAAFVAGTLASRGYFNPYLVYGIFIVKDCVVDGAYYYMGRFAGETALVARLLTRAHVRPMARARLMSSYSITACRILTT
jgi:membrane protein DedA with SNARE-associated domain